MNLEIFNQKFFKKLPDAPGVYFFLDEKGEILYIGKATSLRDRVKSYFTQDILLTRGPKIVRMLELAESIEWQMTDSALEALLFEANLIHKHRPPYNTDAKDDKSWNFVVITKEKFPRVLIERGRKVENEELGMKNGEFRAMFGPFPSGGALKEAVKIIRKIFPFRDTCTSLENKKTSEKKPCFNHQIGLCPGVCVGVVSAREYGKAIRNIILFFEGKKMAIIRNLEREMKREAKMLRFERAGEIKKTLFALAHIQDVALLRRDMFESPSLGGFGESRRIEAYDVAHLGGTDTVGVMTVIIGREKQTSEYRKFIIRGETKGNDLSALEELLRRRLKHTEWELPNLIVVDGGDLQRSVTEAVLKDFSFDIPVVSVVKDARHQPKNILGSPKFGGGDLGPKKERETFKTDILLANSEAHRYAISFHRVRRGKAFLT